LVGLDLLVHHDGYTPAVESVKDKRNRDLRLLRAAGRDDPDNPRWPYFSLRDGLPVLDRAELLTLCAAMGDSSTVNSLCAELDRVDHGDSPDAHCVQSCRLWEPWCAMTVPGRKSLLP